MARKVTNRAVAKSLVLGSERLAFQILLLLLASQAPWTVFSCSDP